MAVNETQLNPAVAAGTRVLEVPVRFAVRDDELRQMFGGIGRTALFAIRKRYGLRRLPGKVTSVFAVAAALRRHAAESQLLAETRKRGRGTGCKST